MAITVMSQKIIYEWSDMHKGVRIIVHDTLSGTPLNVTCVVDKKAVEQCIRENQRTGTVSELEHHSQEEASETIYSDALRKPVEHWAKCIEN
jgi:hypothetical protein